MFIKLGKLFFIHKFFVFLPFVILLRGGSAFYFIMLLSVCLHEAAHLAAAKLSGSSGGRIFISPYGCELRLSSAAPSHEALILLSGPAASLILAGAGFFLDHETLFRANALILAVNLLPAYPLDGGKLLKIALWSVCGVYKGTRVLKKTSFALASLMLVCALCALSVWLAAVSFLIFSRTRSLRGTPFYAKRRRFTPVRVFRVPSSVTPMEALRLFSPYYYTCVFAEQPHRLFTERDIISLAENGSFFAEMPK